MHVEPQEVVMNYELIPVLVHTVPAALLITAIFGMLWGKKRHNALIMQLSYLLILFVVIFTGFYLSLFYFSAVYPVAAIGACLLVYEISKEIWLAIKRRT